MDVPIISLYIKIDFNNVKAQKWIERKNEPKKEFDSDLLN